MSKQYALLLCVILFALCTGGCSKSAPQQPLTLGECKEMKDKQLAMMLAELPKEYQSGFDAEHAKLVLDCDLSNAGARIGYQCTMAARTMSDVEQCQTKNAKH